MLVVGCDFGASARAGLQAQKTVLVEAHRVAERSYQCHESGRNQRLLTCVNASHKPLPKRWQDRRAGWTIAELTKSLVADSSIISAAFDFPFSIPMQLLESAEFAAEVDEPTFRKRTDWVHFLAEHLSLQFDTDKASSALTCLKKVEAWKQQAYWKKRQTDHIAKAQPPLKHLYQNVFNMTVLGALLLEQLEGAGMTTVLTASQLNANQRRCVEAYPAMVARRIGVTGSYKQQPDQCVQKAIDWLAEQNIELQMPDSLKIACSTYQTAQHDYDAADAVLCLVTSICVIEGLAEMLIEPSDSAAQVEEGGIVVPRLPIP